VRLIPLISMGPSLLRAAYLAPSCLHQEVPGVAARSPPGEVAGVLLRWSGSSWLTTLDR